MKKIVHTWLFFSFLWIFGLQAQTFGGGNGTEGNPYQISTPEQLNNLRNYLGGGANSLLHFKLVNDIDLTTYIETHDHIEGWDPIGYWGTGTESTRFKAKIHGGGHTIRGLWINRPTTNYVGLFGILGSGCSVDSLSIEVHSNGIEGSTNVGGLAGIVMAVSTIEDCSSRGSIVGYSNVGGLVGENRSIIKRCYSTGRISGTSSVGGLIGASTIGTAIQISSSYSDADVKGSGSQIGGFIGWNKGQISNCYSTGSVWGEGNGKGGFAGVNGSPGSIVNSYSIGWVSSIEGFNIGGFVGNNASVISNCYFDYSLASIGKGIGLGSGEVEGKSTEQMKQLQTFVGWDFSSIWLNRMYPSFPLLIWEPKSACFEGKGTFWDPYRIGTAEQLYCLHNYIGEVGRGKVFDLVSDIDLAEFLSKRFPEKGWEPIGSLDQPFIGYLCGKGFSIDNLWIHRPDEDYVGLFRVLDNQYSLFDLSIYIAQDSSIVGRDYVGGLCGKMQHCSISNIFLGTRGGHAQVKGREAVGAMFGYVDNAKLRVSCASIHVKGEGSVGGVMGINGGEIAWAAFSDGSVEGVDAVGGLIGLNFCSVQDSWVANSNIVGSTSVGGLCGRSLGGIHECGAVNNHIVGDYKVGGLCGEMGSSAGIGSAYSTGFIEGKEQVGGLVGRNGGGSISSCFSACSIQGEARGGLIGENEGGNIYSSYFDEEVAEGVEGIGVIISGVSSGIYPKSTSEMRKQATFVGWDFQSVWLIQENKTYPYLRQRDFDAPLFPIPTSDFFTFGTIRSLSITLEEHKGEALSFYPNPTEGVIHLNFDEQSLKEVRVWDAKGKIMYSGVSSSMLDLSYLRSGLYVIQVNGQTQKLIKK